MPLLINAIVNLKQCQSLPLSIVHRADIDNMEDYHDADIVLTKQKSMIILTLWPKWPHSEGGPLRIIQCKSCHHASMLFSTNLILNFTHELANSGKVSISLLIKKILNLILKTKSQNIIWDKSHKMLGEDVVTMPLCWWWDRFEFLDRAPTVQAIINFRS